MNRYLDKYILNPIKWDLLLSSILWYLDRYLDVFDYAYLSKNNQLDVISSIIDTCVSLSGFILAALTIIVTFKSNIKAKEMEEAANAMELVFSSKHYKSIVNVFKSAILEYCLVFISLYVVWLMSDNFELVTINRLILSAVLIASLIIFRSLKVLFTVIDLSEKVKKPSNIRQ